MSKTIVRREKVVTNHLPDNLAEIIKQIYASRGMKSAQELELNVTNLKGMLDETALMGMDKACQLLHDALVNKLRIVIVGDFDADGATSTALMMTALNLFNSSNHDFIVPNRFEYGYGLTLSLIHI